MENGESRFKVGVLEEELSIGRSWLHWVETKLPWADAEGEVFSSITTTLRWIEKQKKVGRRWLLTVDVDLSDGDLPERLMKVQKEIEKEDSLLAEKVGVVLLRHLQDEGLLAHVLVVTGVAYGPLVPWLDELGVAYRMKPIRARDVGGSLWELKKSLEGSSGDGGNHGE